MIRNINDAFKQKQLKQESSPPVQKLHRGVGLKQAFPALPSEGQVFVDPAFLSTSQTPQFTETIAIANAQTKPADIAHHPLKKAADQIMGKIRRKPTVTPAISSNIGLLTIFTNTGMDIAPYAIYPTQQEVLLPPSTPLHVLLSGKDSQGRQRLVLSDSGFDSPQGKYYEQDLAISASPLKPAHRLLSEDEAHKRANTTWRSGPLNRASAALMQDKSRSLP
ncbi:hypothetical protein [Bordetella avium]|nr:hypothetical protein [Bordetella avium]AZY48703.1 hypothetical protein C0J09_05770 [Bordetella avium]RIQ70893.1 hypothetical protein D0838_09090 [Bordetella avium]